MAWVRARADRSSAGQVGMQAASSGRRARRRDDAGAPGRHLGSFVVEAEPVGLAHLANPVTVFSAMTFFFSLAGGTLQVLHRAGPGPSRARSVLSQVVGNLMVSTAGSAAVAAWCRRGRDGERPASIPMLVGFTGGLAGGVARLPIDAALWSPGAMSVRSGSLIAGSSGLWLIMAAALTNLISGSATRVLREHERLANAIDAERATRAEMVDAESRFRRSVAERLHGRLQSELLVAARQAEAIDSPQGSALAARLERVREEEVRQLAHSLHPAIVEIDLRTSLSLLCDLVDGAVAVEVEFLDRTAGPADLPGGALERTARLAVHRICEEGIQNAIRHGNASRVNATIEITATDVRVRVEDDGDGLGPGAAGLGLRSVDSWVNAAGGTWSLDNRAAPRGAVLSAVLPAPTGTGG